MKKSLLQAAGVFGRIAAIGAEYGIDLERLFDRLLVLAPECASYSMVTVPERFDRIAVATTITSRETLERVDTLSHDPEQASRLELVSHAGTRNIYVELETVPGQAEAFTVVMQAFGTRELATDLERLASFGVTPGALAALRAIVDTLGGAAHLVGLSDRVDPDQKRSWTLHLGQPNDGEAERAATRDRLDRAAIALGVTKPQRNVVASLHDVLASARPSFALVRVDPDALAAELGIIWSNVPWPHVVRMMMGFYPSSDYATRLGVLAGAIDEEMASAVELILGPAEPPRMRVSATILPGEP